MTQEQALNILIQTAHLAQAKGALLLKDATVVAEAIELFTKKPEEVVPGPSEEEVTND